MTLSSDTLRSLDSLTSILGAIVALAMFLFVYTVGTFIYAPIMLLWCWYSTVGQQAKRKKVE